MLHAISKVCTMAPSHVTDKTLLPSFLECVTSSQADGGGENSGAGKGGRRTRGGK